MYSYCVVIVLVSIAVTWVLAAGWSELDIYILAYTSWNHAFFLVTDFKIGCLGWQNVQPLRSWRVIDDSDFKSMCFIYFETCKFNNWWRCLEYTIRANCVEHVMGSNWICCNTFASANKFLLNFKHVLRLRNRDLINLDSPCSFRQLRFVRCSNVISSSSLWIVSVRLNWNCIAKPWSLFRVLYLLIVV